MGQAFAGRLNQTDDVGGGGAGIGLILLLLLLLHEQRRVRPGSVGVHTLHRESVVLHLVLAVAEGDLEDAVEGDLEEGHLPAALLQEEGHDAADDGLVADHHQVVRPVHGGEDGLQPPVSGG